MALEHVVIAGKSGVGTTTTAVNLSAALAEQGNRVVHVGYDWRRESTALLRGDAPLVAACGVDCGVVKPSCAIGYRDILCIEAGGGEEGGRPAEFSRLCCLDAIARYRPDYVVHDISGEPEGILSFLSGEGDPWRLFVVTTADISAINALNSFIREVFEAGRSGSFGGVVANNLSGPFFESVIADFIQETGAHLAANVPRSMMVSVSEYYGRTLIESAPLSHNTFIYRRFARSVSESGGAKSPRYLDAEGLASWSRKWGEIITELETGVVRDGAAI